MSPMRVVIIDDTRLARQELRTLLGDLASSTPDFRCELRKLVARGAFEADVDEPIVRARRHEDGCLEVRFRLRATCRGCGSNRRAGRSGHGRTPTGELAAPGR